MSPRGGRGLAAGLGGLASLLEGVLLTWSAIGAFTSRAPAGSGGGGPLAIPDNWLVLIFKIHASREGASPALLSAPNAQDFAILALSGLAFVALAPLCGKRDRALSIAAAALPYAGCALLAATRLAGRCSVPLAVVLASLPILRTKGPWKALALIGIAAGSLLFLGDLTVGIESSLITALFGLGYVLFAAWCFMLPAFLLWQQKGKDSASARIDAGSGADE